MDLLKAMCDNRASAGMSVGMTKVSAVKKVEMDIEQEAQPGSKKYRDYIIKDKPKRKKLKLHFQAIVDKECDTSSDEE